MLLIVLVESLDSVIEDPSLGGANSLKDECLVMAEEEELPRTTPSTLAVHTIVGYLLIVNNWS
jgi:hypothetical protein